MASRVINQASFGVWKTQYNLLCQDVGDKALLTTGVTTSFVDAMNDLQDQLDSVVVGAFTLSNNVYFEADAFGGGSVNVFKVDTANKIVFGTPVASIDIQGGTITTLTTPLGLTNGGTGGNSAATARTAMGLAIGTDVQAWDANLDQIAAIAPSANDFIVFSGSAWVKKTVAEVKTILSLVIGTNVQAWDANLDQIAALTPTNDTFLAGTGSTWTNRDAASTRAILSLVIGTNVQAWDANLDQIAALSPATGNFIAGNGSAWAQYTAAQTRDLLGLRVVGDTGVVTVQPYDADLVAIAALSPTLNNIIIGNGSAWVQNTPAQARTNLGLEIGTNVQGYSARLADIAALGVTSGNFIVADGSTWTVKTPSQTRTALNLVIGTDVQAWDVNLDQIAALTPSSNGFLVGNGSAWVLTSGAAARSALGLAIGTNVQAYHAKLADISGLSPASNGMIIWNGSNFITQSGTALLSSIGAASSGANTDITSINGIPISTAWSPTPTIIGTMTMSSAVINQADFARIGPYVYFSFAMTFTLGGTPGAGDVISIGLPVTAVADNVNATFSCAGNENVSSVITGIPDLRYRITTTALLVFKAAPSNTWSVGTNCSVHVRGHYRAV